MPMRKGPEGLRPASSNTRLASGLHSKNYRKRKVRTCAHKICDAAAATLGVWIHFGGTVGCDCHDWHLDRHVVACGHIAAIASEKLYRWIDQDVAEKTNFAAANISGSYSD